MKRLMFAMAAMTLSASALAADVAVSAGMGQLNYYGRIEIDNASRPELIYAAPIVIEPIPAGVVARPIYLHVPPGHLKNWGRHCHRYNACGQPVYFVQETWFKDVFVARYRAAAPPVPLAAPQERLFVVPVKSVRAVVGAPEQRCWVERRQVVEDRGDANVPGAIAGAVIGGVLGHQVGGGRGRDVATVGGAVAGAAIGANVGRGSPKVYGQDVQRCANDERPTRPAYWDVSYKFRGVIHRAQLRVPPGRTITVDARGEPRV